MSLLRRIVRPFRWVRLMVRVSRLCHLSRRARRLGHTEMSARFTLLALRELDDFRAQR